MDLFLPLPIELVLHVITCAIPASPDVILPPLDPTTRLLISFTLVCHETRRLADRYIRQHCAYLPDLLSLFRFLGTIPYQPQLKTITSLSLSPFQDDIDDLPLSNLVRDLLCFTSVTLRKLVIDIPLRSLYPEDDHKGVRKVLREGFQGLVNLEEFVSTQDELYLDVTEGERTAFWTRWPKLKRLALYNVAADSDFWRNVAYHSSLHTLVLTEPDCLIEDDPKALYYTHSTRPLRVVVCRVSTDFPNMTPEYLESADWSKYDQKRTMTLLAHPLPDWESRKRSIKEAAEASTLWDWDGDEITYPEQMTTIT